jgi:hypothetical protein
MLGVASFLPSGSPPAASVADAIRPENERISRSHAGTGHLRHGRIISLFKELVEDLPLIPVGANVVAGVESVLSSSGHRHAIRDALCVG